ncbi:MAG TPA: hypothetical protein VKA36_09500 [Solirubrobacterales bacterium]|nr:hypothetical protein [Solirubrobacterales bacterium]
MTNWTHKSTDGLEDLAPGHGLDEIQEFRRGTEAVGSGQIGFSRQLIKSGRRQPFGHMHAEHEEIVFVITGGGRVKLDDEIVDVRPHDVIRVGTGVTRAMEADAQGLEVLIFGPVGNDEGTETIQGWWGG